MAQSAPKRTWTVQEALDWTRAYLERKGDENPRLSAEWLLSAATGLSRLEVYAYFDRPLDKHELATLHEGVARRAKGEPLQYVTGEMGFRHIVVRCEPGALIPRPETEWLVEYALPQVKQAVASRGCARVLEVGTGTGCIACSIASEVPQAQVVATDISPDAISLATRNAEALSLADRIAFVCCDLDAGLAEQDRAGFDLLISNPPYIPTAELPTLPREVSGYEPELALDGGADGLDVFRRLLACAPTWLAPGGLLACELHEATLAAAAQLASQAGLVDVQIKQDLAGRDRVLLASVAS